MVKGITGKELEQEGKGAGPWLAFKAAVIVCALANHSCLVPQSVDAIVESPHPAPLVESVPSYLSQPVLTLYRQGSFDASQTPPCHCSLTFDQIVVEEDDPTVNLQVKWFIDYNSNNLATVRTWDDKPLSGTFNDPTLLKRTLPSFNFDADAFGIVQEGTHRFDVVIGEAGKFDPTSTTQPNRAMLSGYHSAVATFVVNLRYARDPSLPSCPSTPPSQRVCQ